MMRDKSRPIGLRAEEPHIYELSDLLEFCHKYDEIYIYGSAIKQQMLYKLLSNSTEIPLRGYVVSELNSKCDQDCASIYALDEVLQRRNAGIILGLADGHYRYVIPELRQRGFTDYFVPTEWNKRAIAEKMEPRDADYNSFEISLVDHCNMSCQMCDHFSQLSEPWFISPDVLDLDRFDFILLLPSNNQALNDHIRIAFKRKLHNRRGIILEGCTAREILNLYSLFEFTDKLIVGSFDLPHGRKLRNLIDTGVATEDELINDVILEKLNGTNS